MNVIRGLDYSPIREIIAGFTDKGEIHTPWLQQIIVENISSLTIIAQVVAIIAGSLAILGGLWAILKWLKLKKNYSIKKRT